MMPDMDGWSVLSELKSDAALSEIPVIMLSGKDGAFAKVRGRVVGASEYLTKPFTPAELLEAVRRYLPGAVSANVGAPS